MKLNQINFYKILLILLSSVLYAITFPRVNLWYVAYFSLVPLFYAIEKVSVKSGFLSGLLIGTISGVFMFYWVTVAMTVYGGINWFFSALLLLALGLIIGLLFFAPMTALITYLSRKGINLLFTAAPLWVSFEYLKTYIFTGFPWNLFGYSQKPFLEIIQASDVTGVYGISFLLVVINTGIFYSLKRYLTLRKFITTEMVVAFLLFFLFLTYGIIQEHRWNSIIQEGKPISFGLIQGNINQDQKWDKAYQDETMRIYTELTQKSYTNGAEFVIWPETATPFYFQSTSTYREEVRSLVKINRKWLIFGSPAYSYFNKTMHLYNSAYSISSEGEITGRYDKMHLVPFGEYVPLKKILFFVDKLVPAAGDFSAGEEIVLLNAGEYKVGMSICYEIIFPSLVRKFAKQGADILVTITNDAWFGKTSAPYQHFAMAAFRAVENRRALLRAANTGITGYVDQTGRVIAKTDIFTTDWLNGTIRVSSEMSFYTKYGDVFCWLMCLWVVLLLIVGYLRTVEQ